MVDGFEMGLMGFLIRDGFDSINLGLPIRAWWWSRGFVPISAWCVVVDEFEMGLMGFD
jgi:hypothetical protein